MKYKISNEALKDLEKIWLYTKENWSAEQADRYFKLMIDEINYLTVRPESGKDISYIRKGYYRSKVKSHYIFYRRNTKILEVIRILHQSMDIESRLNE